MIHLILLSQDFPRNRYKWIILINLLMGYRNDHMKKIESTILNLFLNYFYDHRNHKSEIENCLLDRNHSEILEEALFEANHSQEAALRLFNVIKFIKKCILCYLQKKKHNELLENSADLFPKLITIMDFVFLKKYDDLIDFDNLEISEGESKNPLEVVNCIYNRLISKDHSNIITTAVTPIKN